VVAGLGLLVLQMSAMDSSALTTTTAAAINQVGRVANALEGFFVVGTTDGLVHMKSIKSG
jgi:hypothetical protein